MMQSKRSGNRTASRYKGGRPRTAVEARTPRADGKLAAWLPKEDMMLAQRLMLHFPQAKTIDELCSLALRRLSATTDE